jgi:hypothetical protein
MDARSPQRFTPFQRAAGRTFRRTVKSTPAEKNGGVPLRLRRRASGSRRFVFIDNHDSSAFFEFVLDADGHKYTDTAALVGVAEDNWASRRPHPRRPEWRDLSSPHPHLIAGAKSMTDWCCHRDGDPHADAMDGFRSWLLAQEAHSIGRRWNRCGRPQHRDLAGSRANAPARPTGTGEPGRISMIQVPSMPARHVDDGGAGTPSARIRNRRRAGIRDISYASRPET